MSMQEILEQQARHARYQAFTQHLKNHEILVLAHHQQDQAETLLLRSTIFRCRC